MSVTKEASGRRSVEINIELPGTPEEVWKAIATGPGVSSWFVPTEFEEQGGRPVAMTSRFGPEMIFRATIKDWNPPQRFISENEGWGGSPAMATEWIVEAQSGGTCSVRIVQSLFASTDEWDDQLEAGKQAWLGFFRTLQLYLTHFRGQASKISQFVAPVPGTAEEAWESLTGALGQKDVKVGERWTAPAGAPAFGGVAEYLTKDPYDALLRLDEPGPGIAALGAFNMGGQSMVALNFYFYGDKAGETFASEAPKWAAWFQERFPMPAEPSHAA